MLSRPNTVFTISYFHGFENGYCLGRQRILHGRVIHMYFNSAFSDDRRAVIVRIHVRNALARVTDKITRIAKPVAHGDFTYENGPGGRATAFVNTVAARLRYLDQGETRPSS